jgi:molybdopterin/thiamine biosynthesis adenylyltransferase
MEEDREKIQPSAILSAGARDIAKELDKGKEEAIWWDQAAKTHKTWRVGQHSGVPLSRIPMCFTQEAIEKLLISVGHFPPETGAKGYGPKDRMGFAVIEFDQKGSDQAGGAIYVPDVEWGDRTREYYLDQPDDKMMVWDGDLHSHPGGYGHPSPKAGTGLGDLGYVEEVFDQNEWMEWFFLPIITGSGTDDVVIHPWVCRRGRGHSPMLAELRICEVEEFPERECNPQWERKIASSFEKDINVQDADEESSWIDMSDPVKRNNPPEEEPVMEKPEPPKQLERSAKQADSAKLRKEYMKRLKGLISDDFQNKTILTIGVGAGSYAVEKLARLSPARLKNCDFDFVEVSNLARTSYALDDVGHLKVEALAKRISRINPLVEVLSYPRNLCKMSAPEIEELFRGVDLVIGGTDQFLAQAKVNEIAVKRGIPAVWIGIHARGEGGRIVWYVPGGTGCYRCVAAERYATAAQPKAGGALNLDGMVGSLLDCQFIDMVALKIAVAILERGQDSLYGRFYERMRGRNDVVVRCHPDYAWGSGIWDAMLGDLPKQPKDFGMELKQEAILAMDTIWMKGPVNAECPVCGNSRRELRGENASSGKNEKEDDHEHVHA